MVMSGAMVAAEIMAVGAMVAVEAILVVPAMVLGAMVAATD
jgi:hypothetical protein